MKFIFFENENIIEKTIQKEEEKTKKYEKEKNRLLAEIKITE